jgi:hypothetical protein
MEGGSEKTSRRSYHSRASLMTEEKLFRELFNSTKNCERRLRKKQIFALSEKFLLQTAIFVRELSGELLSKAFARESNEFLRSREQVVKKVY